MNQLGLNLYRDNVANTVETKNNLLFRLYDEAIKAVVLARRGIKAQNPKVRGENISKAMAILTELDCALDNELGGEIAQNLSALYTYMIDRLTVANIKMDSKALDEVENLLREILEGFRGALHPKPVTDHVTDAPLAEHHSQGGLRVAV